MDAITSPVVAYVDGSASSNAAVRWAARETVGRDTNLLLLAAMPVPDGSQAAQRALRAATTEARSAAGATLRVATRIDCGDETDILVAESQRAAMMCLAAHDVRTWSILAATRSPVVLIWNPRGQRSAPADGWVVAATADRAAARRVLRTAIAEAVLRDSALMAMVPDGPDPGACVTEAEFAGADLDVWVMPQPVDLVAMLLQHPDLDHLIVTTAGDTALLRSLLGRPELDAMQAGLEVLVLPRCAEVSTVRRRCSGAQAPSLVTFGPVRSV